MESDPLESSYPTYSVESDPLEPSYTSVIRLTSDSSASSVSPAPPSVRGCGFIRTHAVLYGRGCAHGGGWEDDAPGGFGIGYLPFDG